MAQSLQGAPAPFILMDEDSPTNEEASPTKRRRHTIKLDKLRTRDTHVVLKIKWPYEMVCSAQSKAPIYEEMSLASFTHGYLGIVAEEKGSPTGEVMLRHLWILLQDVDVYGLSVVREYHTACLQLLEQGRAALTDKGESTELRCLMVCSKPSLSSRFSNPPPTPVVSTASRPPLPFTNQGWVGRYNFVS